MAIAPIAIFTYCRPGHTRRTVESLLKNPLASESDLIIYSDAARAPEKQPAVDAVRAYLATIAGFRSVTIKHRSENYGLAKSIIQGVTEVLEQSNRIIVLEDDIVTSPNFLSFMNTALDRYADESRVWHISGWNYPIDPEGLGDAFLWRVMNCWGWATWSDRWKHFQKTPGRLIENWGQDKIKRFNLDGGHDFWSQVTRNYSGEINSWSIFWYASIFEKNGLCLNVTQRLAQNIGLEGSGVNCGNNQMFDSERLGKPISEFPHRIEESILAVDRVCLFYKKQSSLFLKIARRMRNLIGNAS